MTRLQKRKSHRSTTLHMCRYELRDKGSGLLHRKAERMDPNDVTLLSFLSDFCGKDHDHEPLQSSSSHGPRTRQAGRWTEELRDSILAGLARCLWQDRLWSEAMMQSVGEGRRLLVRRFADLRPEAREAFEFLAGTTRTLPQGRYKQYGPIWQGGRSQPVLTIGARRNPLALMKAYGLKNMLKPDIPINGVVLTRKLNTIPMVYGATSNAMTTVWSESHDMFILAKLCPTSPGMLNRFGECNTITWYQIKPNDELMDQEGVIKISNHEQKDLGPDLALLIPTPLEDRQGPLPFLWQTEPHPAPSAPRLADEMADEARTADEHDGVEEGRELGGLVLRFADQQAG